ncbi:MAG: DNA primase [Nitrososphaeraceae archaeon]
MIVLSIILGKDDLAKYPFLEEAGNYIRETHFDLDDFNRSEFLHIIERATKRIEFELIQGKVFIDLEKYDIELFTFLVSLIIMKYINEDSAIKKFSLFEAMRVERFLISDLSKERDLTKKNLLISKIFRELFHLDVELDPNNNNVFKMNISDYLQRATSFNEEEWKLIGRAVDNGYVYLDGDETVRLIRYEIYKLMYNRLKNMKITKIPDQIKLHATLIKNKFLPAVKYTATITDLPPCIKKALELLNKNENLPHSARFMLATYMLSAGKSVDEVVLLFQNAPDYNEKITKYQVEHLAGKKGSQTKYSVPACSKLVNENLCYATIDCKGITNPIQFGRKNRK